MTVETGYSPAKATGNGSTTAFPYSFVCYNQSDLNVYITDTTTDVDTLQVLNTDYTVSLDSDYIGGTVTFSTAPSATDRVTIAREVALYQTQDYRVAGRFPSESTERQLDNLTLGLQQVNEVTERSLVLPITATDGISLTLPLPVAGRAFVWNDDEDAIVNSTYDFTDIEGAVSDELDIQVGPAVSAYLASNPPSGLTEIVQDTTPQLGGTLACNGYAVTSFYLGSSANGGDNLFTRLVLKDESETVYAAGNVSGDVVFDYTNGHVQSATLTGNVTSITFSNLPAAGGWITLILTQDGTGNRTADFAGFYSTDASIALSTGAGAIDKVYITYDGSNLYIEGLGKDFQLIT